MQADEIRDVDNEAELAETRRLGNSFRDDTDVRFEKNLLAATQREINLLWQEIIDRNYPYDQYMKLNFRRKWGMLLGRVAPWITDYTNTHSPLEEMALRGDPIRSIQNYERLFVGNDPSAFDLAIEAAVKAEVGNPSRRPVIIKRDKDLLDNIYILTLLSWPDWP